MKTCQMEGKAGRTRRIWVTIENPVRLQEYHHAWEKQDRRKAFQQRRQEPRGGPRTANDQGSRVMALNQVRSRKRAEHLLGLRWLD